MNSTQLRHVIITGGAGFIGSHLCDVLLSKGYFVTAIDNLLTGDEKNLQSAKKSDRFQFIREDVCNVLSVDSFPFVKSHGLFGVFHFACPASPVDFDRIPFDILAVDSLGTMRAVDWAFKWKSRFLLASTSEIYGDPLEHPQKETYFGNVNTTGPRACYDETKRFAEAYVTSAMRGLGLYHGKPFEALNAGIVRIFNTYGPRMRPDDGRVVPELCMQGLSGQDMFLHGGGTQTRSFCYVDDLVDGVVRLFEGGYREIVNIGNPIELPIRDFAEVVKRLTGGKSKILAAEARPDDPKRRCPDISKAKKLLAWEPKVSLEVGLARSLDFFKAHRKGS